MEYYLRFLRPKTLFNLIIKVSMDLNFSSTIRLTPLTLWVETSAIRIGVRH